MDDPLILYAIKAARCHAVAALTPKRQ